MPNSEYSVFWNTAYSIVYEDYAVTRTKLHDNEKSYAEKCRKQHKTIAQRAEQYNAKWNEVMLF